MAAFAFDCDDETKAPSKYHARCTLPLYNHTIFIFILIFNQEINVVIHVSLPDKINVCCV